MEKREDLPLCQECDDLKFAERAAQKDYDTAEHRLLDAEDALEQAQIELLNHRGEGHTNEDDPWLLHQLAEKMGQTRMF